MNLVADLENSKSGGKTNTAYDPESKTQWWQHYSVRMFFFSRDMEAELMERWMKFNTGQS